jgi:hypothetical protein
VVSCSKRWKEGTNKPGRKARKERSREQSDTVNVVILEQLLTTASNCCLKPSPLSSSSIDSVSICSPIFCSSTATRKRSARVSVLRETELALCEGSEWHGHEGEDTKLGETQVER